jgi:hypothetical protein
MALVERLMGLSPDGTTNSNNDVAVEAKIAVHTFFAAQSEIIEGRLTVAGVKNFLNMDAETQAEYDSLVAKAPTGTTALAVAQKQQYINGIHSVFMLAEAKVPGYATPAQVRSKLGI